MVDIGITLIWQVVNFILLFLLLRRFLFRPVGNFLRQRRERIIDRLDESERVREEAHRLRESYRSRLSRARDEARRLIEEAEREGEQRKKEIISAADSRAVSIVDRAEKEVERRYRKARQELHDEVVELSVAAAEGLLEKELEEEDHRQLIARAIEETGEI